MIGRRLVQVLALGLAMLALLAGCGPLLNADTRLAGLPRAATPSPLGIDVSYVASVQTLESLPTRRIIYVHGTPGDASSYARYLREPIAGTHAIAIDRPGFGQTGGPVVCSFEDQARALEPFLLDGDRVVLVGHSLGGPIVARAAADYPDRVGAIVILAGSLDPDLEDLRWFNYAGGALHPLLPRTLRHSNMEIFDAGKQTRLLAGVLDRVVCPVVIVHGTEDTLVPHANVEYMKRAFRNAASVDALTLHDADHFIPWTHEPEVRAAVELALELSSEDHVLRLTPPPARTWPPS